MEILGLIKYVCIGGGGKVKIGLLLRGAGAVS